MFTLFVQILIFLSAAFILGVVLGWVLWKFGTSKKMASELLFWKKRLDQERLARDLDQTKISTLEEECAKLKEQLAS